MTAPVESLPVSPPRPACALLAFLEPPASERTQKLTIALTSTQLSALSALAVRFGVAPETLAWAVIVGAIEARTHRGSTRD